MNPAFNLLDEPWILAADRKGGTAALSVAEAFARAHELTELSGELPAQDVAVLRLLLAILHAALPDMMASAGSAPGNAANEEAMLAFWQGLWREGRFPMDGIGRYLDRYRERF